MWKIQVSRKIVRHGYDRCLVSGLQDRNENYIMKKETLSWVIVKICNNFYLILQHWVWLDYCKAPSDGKLHQRKLKKTFPTFHFSRRSWIINISFHSFSLLQLLRVIKNSITNFFYVFFSVISLLSPFSWLVELWRRKVKVHFFLERLLLKFKWDKICDLRLSCGWNWKHKICINSTQINN